MRATLPDGTVLQRSRNAALIAAILWPGMAARASAHLHPLAIAAGLGQAAEWPLPWRLSLDLLADPGVRWRVALALMAAGGGVASAVIGLCWRRGRLVLLLVCAGLLAAAAPTVRLLLVPAYPTSFFRSPTAFAAASILRGQAVFATHCATCHGAGARGDGPMAGQLPVRPADLTAAHIASHSDGDLFWWIGNGIKTDDGTQAMPPFAAVLPAEDRWAAIDFIRANNAGASRRNAGAWIAPVAAPSLPVVCADLPADDMQDLRGSVVRVVAGGGEDLEAHPPAIPPQQGYKVVVLHLSRNAAMRLGAGACLTATQAGWNAYALLAGVAPDALPGAEFLVDPQGWLRAAWLPGSGRGWSTPDELIARVRLICTHPVERGDHDGAHD